MDKIKVLIVDDQTLMRDGLKTILSLEENIEVVALAKDGAEALELCSKIPIDLVLMDIRMPKVNGVQCTKEIKSRYPHISVLILTTFDDDEYITEALSNGASGYILKFLVKQTNREEIYKECRERFQATNQHYFHFWLFLQFA